jgi:1-deoxy-D-xylulose-5-phosphate reductoisomerase
MAVQLGAKFAAVADPAGYADLREGVAGHGIEIACGEEAMIAAARRPADLVVSAIVGAVGLAPTYAAIEEGRTIALANKETLVCAGTPVTRAAARYGATLLPLDSEHNAIFQALGGRDISEVVRMTVTASGGPFRKWSADRIAAATRAEALAHPKWAMGPKISIDSASLMNKGLELIEAHHLFDIPVESIEVVIHPQSLVHSLVEFRDGALIAQLGFPDMRLPIQIALMHPEKPDTDLPRPRPDQFGTLTWEAPDSERFPAIKLARAVALRGGTAPAILNAANEAAVAAFLEGKIGFNDICGIAAGALGAVEIGRADALEPILEADAAARSWVRNLLERSGVTVIFSRNGTGSEGDRTE